jgi:hypothetical protein
MGRFSMILLRQRSVGVAVITDRTKNHGYEKTWGTGLLFVL